jgi:Transposase DDE domain
VAFAECGTRAVIDAAFGPYRTGEQTLTRELLSSMGPGILVLADRNFPSYRLWHEAAATGADLLWRASATFTLPVREVLSDGTDLSELRPARRRDGEPIPVRVIEYSVVGYDGCSEVFALLTTLLDPTSAPAPELAELYAQRWELETAMKGIKVGQRGVGPAWCCDPTTPTASPWRSGRCCASTRRSAT